MDVIGAPKSFATVPKALQIAQRGKDSEGRGGIK